MPPMEDMGDAPNEGMSQLPQENEDVTLDLKPA